MMATFMLMMIPRAAVCADRISEVLDTALVGRPSIPSGALAERARPGRVSRRGLSVPGRRRSGAARHLISRLGRGDTRDHRQHRCRQDHARVADSPAVRRDRMAKSARRRRCASARPRSALGPHRSGAAAAVSVLRHGREQPALRQSQRHGRGAVGGAASRSGTRLRAGNDRRPAGAYRPGRHQRVRRPASAPIDRAGAGAQAGDLPVRRVVLRARSGHRCAAARGTAAGHTRCGRRDRRAARLHDRGRRPDCGARGRHPRRPRPPRGAAAQLSAPTRKSSNRSCPPRRPREQRPPQGRANAAARRGPGRRPCRPPVDEHGPAGREVDEFLAVGAPAAGAAASRPIPSGIRAGAGRGQHRAVGDRAGVHRPRHRHHLLRLSSARTCRRGRPRSRPSRRRAPPATATVPKCSRTCTWCPAPGSISPHSATCC